jgi:hypothetical protein
MADAQGSRSATRIDANGAAIGETVASGPRTLVAS